MREYGSSVKLASSRMVSARSAAVANPSPTTASAMFSSVLRDIAFAGSRPVWTGWTMRNVNFLQAGVAAHANQLRAQHGVASSARDDGPEQITLSVVRPGQKI